MNLEPTNAACVANYSGKLKVFIFGCVTCLCWEWGVTYSLLLQTHRELKPTQQDFSKYRCCCGNQYKPRYEGSSYRCYLYFSVCFRLVCFMFELFCIGLL